MRRTRWNRRHLWENSLWAHQNNVGPCRDLRNNVETSKTMGWRHGRSASRWTCTVYVQCNFKKKCGPENWRAGFLYEIGCCWSVFTASTRWKALRKRKLHCYTFWRHYGLTIFSTNKTYTRQQKVGQTKIHWRPKYPTPRPCPSPRTQPQLTPYWVNLNLSPAGSGTENTTEVLV